MVKPPSTLGIFLRSFRWGQARQLDRVSRQLPTQAWAAGAGPGSDPLTTDLASTVCETCKKLSQNGTGVKGGTRIPSDWDREKWVVEHTVTWLSKCRAILVRYDKKASNYIGLIQLAFLLLWSRRRRQSKS